MEGIRKLFTDTLKEAGGSDELKKNIPQFMSEKAAQLSRFLERARDLSPEKVTKLVGSQEGLKGAASEKLSHLLRFVAEYHAALPSSEDVGRWAHWALTVGLPAAVGLLCLYFFFDQVLWIVCCLLRCIWSCFCFCLRAAGVVMMKAPGTAGAIIPRFLFVLNPKLYFAGLRATTKLASTSKYGLIVLSCAGVVYALKRFGAW